MDKFVPHALPIRRAGEQREHGVVVLLDVHAHPQATHHQIGGQHLVGGKD